MIATWDEFFNLVCETRRYQKEYFRTKSAFALDMSRRKERELDTCIEQREQKRARKQPELKNIMEAEHGADQTECKKN